MTMKIMVHSFHNNGWSVHYMAGDLTLPSHGSCWISSLTEAGAKLLKIDTGKMIAVQREKCPTL